MDPVEIEKISMRNFSGNFKYFKGILNNASIKFKIRVILKVFTKIDFRFLGEIINSINEEKVVTLFDFDTGFKDVDRIQMDKGQIMFKTSKTETESLKLKTNKNGAYRSNLSIRNSDIRQTNIKNCRVNYSSIPLFGGPILLNGPFSFTDIDMYGANINNCSIKNIKLPTLHFRDLCVKGIKIEKMISDGFLITSKLHKQSAQIAVNDVVSIAAKLEMEIVIKTDKIEYSDLNGSFNGREPALHNMKFDVTLKDVGLKELNVKKSDMQKVAIGL